MDYFNFELVNFPLISRKQKDTVGLISLSNHQLG